MANNPHQPILGSQEFTTIVETDLFVRYPAAAYWLGAVCTEGEVSKPQEFTSGRILRAESYIDENHFLGEESRQADGGEEDIDDQRSTHLVAIENIGHGQCRTIGNMRSIRKRDDGDLLPVERLFPEAFEDAPAPVNAVEASRFISRNEVKSVRNAVSLGLIRAIVSRAYENEQKPIFAVVEEPLARRLLGVGLPGELIADPKPLTEYAGTVNMALRFDPEEIFAVVEKDIERSKIITHFFDDVKNNKGVGYYDSTLQKFIKPLS
jgi:N-acyl-L-homoserine lactone synthetase